jgi:hypothetical protein
MNHFAQKGSAKYDEYRRCSRQTIGKLCHYFLDA